MFDPHDPGPDYELVWPRALFISEAKALLSLGAGLSRGTVLHLLEEAFASQTPIQDLDSRAWQSASYSQELFRAYQETDSLAQQYLTTVLAAADALPEQSSPRPYYAQRHRRDVADAPGPAPDRGVDLRRDWSRLVTGLQGHGYLDRVAPGQCVDDRDFAPPDEVLDSEVSQRLGSTGLWLSAPELWDDDQLYSLIEVFHDLVARPRARDMHDYNRCGWHYSSFAVNPGRVLYRWQVNRLLTKHGVQLQLATSGEDAGRLVHATGDDRDRLITEALEAPEGARRDAVHHAVALFRNRTGTREEKRSAIVALAGDLENHRVMLKQELLSKDEGALFQIANGFDLRHRNPQQLSNYNDAYLDWVFWIYLATTALINDLLQQQHGR